MPPVQPTVLWPLVVYVILVAVVVASMLGLSYVLGQHHHEPATGEPYESGIVSFGSAQVRFGVRFYLIAAFFVIFDLESAFIFAWAVAIRQASWVGFVGIVSFVVTLIVGLIYLWRLGALDVGATRSSPRAGPVGESSKGAFEL